MGLGISKQRALAGLCLTGMMTALASSAYATAVDRPYFKASSVVIVFGSSDFQENGGVAPVVYDFHLLDDATPDTAAPDLIAADGRPINFNTGRFNPIQSGDASGWEFEILNPDGGGAFISAGPHQTLDANDSYTPFGLADDTDVALLGRSNRASQFYVVSNVPFDIYGQASNLVKTGDFVNMDFSNIRYRLRNRLTGGNGVNQWGSAAQDPSIGGSGIVLGADGQGLATLADMTASPVKVFDGGQRTAANPGSLMEQAVSFQSRYNLRGVTNSLTDYDFSMGIGTLSADVTYTVYTP